MFNEPSNSDDVIDSRDVIARIEELESSCLPYRATLVYNDDQTPTASDDFATWDEAQEFITDLLSALDSDESANLFKEVNTATAGHFVSLHAGPLSADIAPNPDADADEAEELATLKAFADEAENYADDWHHGATLIRESYFAEYAEELVTDIGDMPAKIPSYIVIDWEKTADNLRVDYTEIDFDGVAYLVR